MIDAEIAEELSRPTAVRPPPNMERYDVLLADMSHHPDQAALETLFSGPGSVSEAMMELRWCDYQGMIPARVASGVYTMLLFSFNVPMRNETAMAHARSRGCRPATHEELLAFAKAHPELQEQFNIVALGTFVMHEGSRYFAMLGADKGGRTFRYVRRGLTWSATRRLLFVQDPPKEN